MSKLFIKLKAQIKALYGDKNLDTRDYYLTISRDLFNQLEPEEQGVIRGYFGYITDKEGNLIEI